MEKLYYVIMILALFLVACNSTSNRDRCYDSKKNLWNVEIDDNRYEGNERYWDAIRECDNKYN
jgi:hypothetical protein